MPALSKPTLGIVWAQAGLANPYDDLKQAQGFIPEIPDYDNFNWLMQQFSQMNNYLNEQGIGDYSATTTYWLGSIVKDPVTKQLYQSQDDDNLGNALSDPAFWSNEFVGGGIRWSTETANFGAEAGRGYLLDGGLVATLPLAPSDGDEIDFADYMREWGATPSTVAGNGKNIEGSPSYSLRQNGSMVRMVFSTETDDWQVITVAHESPHLGLNYQIRTNPQIINENLTIAAADNGGSFGPMTIAVGSTVTVSPGATWSIV